MMFDLQPRLKGEFLELRPLRTDDYLDLYTAAADPFIWEQHPNADRCTKDGFEVFFRDALDSGGALIALDTSDNKVIGSSRYHAYNREESEVEIGWTFLARSHWGGINNGEMKRLMLQHAFKSVHRVIFLIGPENFRSQRAVEKIGATRVGQRPDGAGRNSFVYEITVSSQFLDR